MEVDLSNPDILPGDYTAEEISRILSCTQPRAEAAFSSQYPPLTTSQLILQQADVPPSEPSRRASNIQIPFRLKDHNASITQFRSKAWNTLGQSPKPSSLEQVAPTARWAEPEPPVSGSAAQDTAFVLPAWVRQKEDEEERIPDFSNGANDHLLARCGVFLGSNVSLYTPMGKITWLKA